VEQRNSTARRVTLAKRATRVRLLHRKSTGLMAVYETDGADTGAMPRMLVFESDTVRTRMTNYPENWQALSDAELSKLRKRTLE